MHGNKASLTTHNQLSMAISVASPRSLLEEISITDLTSTPILLRDLVLIRSSQRKERTLNPILLLGIKE